MPASLFQFAKRSASGLSKLNFRVWHMLVGHVYRVKTGAVTS